MNIKINRSQFALFRVLLKRDLRRKGIKGWNNNTPKF